MIRNPLFELMDEMADIVNNTPTIDAPLKLARMANAEGTLGVEALCHLLVLEMTRRRFADAKYLNASRELEAMGESQ